jgi:hypothetical protein
MVYKLSAYEKALLLGVAGLVLALVALVGSVASTI